MPGNCLLFHKEKKRSEKSRAKDPFIERHIQIAEATTSSVKKALEYPSVNDFEDAMEYYAAVENKCSCIITEDVDDFYFSELEVLNREDFV